MHINIICQGILAALLSNSSLINRQELFPMQAGDHANHDYSMYFSFAGGCCDCGDPTSWKPSGFCPNHTGQTSRQQHQAKLDAIEEVTARAVLSWAVQELCRAVCTSVRLAGKYQVPTPFCCSCSLCIWVTDSSHHMCTCGRQFRLHVHTCRC